MPYYKDAENKVYWLTEKDVLNGWESRIPDGSVQITDEEAYALNNPPETPEQAKSRIKAEIASIEQADLMNRRAREAFILQAEQIAADQYGLTPEQLYAVNPGYKGAKDVDDQVKALRARL